MSHRVRIHDACRYIYSVLLYTDMLEVSRVKGDKFGDCSENGKQSAVYGFYSGGLLYSADYYVERHEGV